MSAGRFAKAAGILVVAIFISRLLGLLRESIIAAQIGQGDLADIYKMAFRLPDLLYFLVAGGAISSAFVPVFTEYLSTNRQKEAWKIYSSVATVMGLVTAVLLVLAMIFARQLVPLIAWGFDGPSLDRTAHLTRILLPAQFFFLIGTLTMGTLYARRNFIIPAMGPIIYNLGIIIGGAFFIKYIGVDALAWGALIGAFTGNFLLQILYSARLGITYVFSLDTSHPGVRKVFLMMLPVILGLGLPQLDVIINQSFASLLSDGAVAALDNANRLMQLPLGIFGQAAGIAALPTLSALAAQKDWKVFKETLSFGVRSVFFTTIPCSALMIVLAKPIIALVLQAGKFKASDTDFAAVALIYYSVGIFAWGGQAVVARGFYSLQDTKTPVILGTIMTVFFIPLNWILMKLMGHGGLALATSVMAIIYLLSLTIVLAYRLNGIGAREMLVSAIKITAASVGASLAAWQVASAMKLMESTEHVARVKAEALAQIIPAALAFLVVYLILCRLFKTEELKTFATMLKRRKTPAEA